MANFVFAPYKLTTIGSPVSFLLKLACSTRQRYSGDEMKYGYLCLVHNRHSTNGNLSYSIEGKRQHKNKRSELERGHGGAGEMTQWLRALTAPEVLGLIPSTGWRLTPSVTPVLMGTGHAYSAQICMQANSFR